MTPFKPHHNHGKIIELYFGTKANAMTKLNVSRPTIDKICNVSINDIFTSLNSF